MVRDCVTVTVEEESEPNESEIDVVVQSIGSPSPGVIEVSVVVENTIISGDGQDWQGDVIIEIDGTPVANTTASAAAGSSTTTLSFEITDVAPGSHEVCADANDSDSTFFG